MSQNENAKSKNLTNVDGIGTDCWDVIPVHSCSELGRINAIYSYRFNLDKSRREENILWFFTQYDISMIPSLGGEEPKSIVATNGNYRFANIDNVKTDNRGKIQNNGSVYKCETLESGVLYGPSKTITNVNNHWAENPQSAIVETNTVAHKDKLESNATIVCGASIVGNAFIGAGADISMDVRLWRTADERPAMPGASGGG